MFLLNSAPQHLAECVLHRRQRPAREPGDILGGQPFLNVPGNVHECINMPFHAPQTQSCLFVRVEHVERVVARGIT